MIRFETKLNAETTKQLNKFSLKKYLWAIILFSVLIALGGVFGGFIFPEDDADRTMGIALIVVAVLITPLTWLLTRLIQRGMDKSASYIVLDTDEVYAFDDEKVTIIQTNEQFNSNLTAKYGYFYKVKETATHYYFYISKAQCHVVPKSSITEGSIEELNALLLSKLGAKFAPCKTPKEEEKTVES